MAYHTDATRTARDVALFRRNRELLRPLDDYLAKVARLSDAFLRGDREAGRCALHWLTAWAGQGALLAEPTAGAQARSQRRWAVAGLGLTALKVWEEAPSADRALLRSYVLRLAAAVQRDAIADRPRNNLLYWAGLVYAIVGVLADDGSLFAQAVGICRGAVASLSPQGSLPLEDQRRDRAVDYNGFALFPLSVIAAINRDRLEGCSVSDLRPLAEYVLANRERTSDQFLRWAPFMGMAVPLRPEVLFYGYGGGSLGLVAERVPTLVQGMLPP